MITKEIVSTITLSIAVQAFACGAMAQTHDFVNVIDNTGQFESFTICAGNESGLIAFIAELDSGESGVFTIDQTGTLNTIVDTTGLFDAFTYPNAFDINNDGDLVYVGRASAELRLVLVNSGGEVTIDTFNQSTGVSAIVADDGTVVYGTAGTSGDGVFRYDPVTGQTTTIEDESGNFNDFKVSNFNANGDFSLVTFEAGVGQAVHKVTDSDLILMIDPDPNVFQYPSVTLDNSGRIICSALGFDGTTKILISDGDTTQTYADEQGPFEQIYAGFANRNGHIHVWGNPARNLGLPYLSGFFSGLEPLNDSYLAIGFTPIFGSDVTGGRPLLGQMLLDNNQTLFSYFRDDDVDGILRAIPNATTIDSLTVTFGNEAGGDITDIELSDNAYFRVRSSFGFLSSEPNLIRLRIDAVTSTENATEFHAMIESKANNPQGTATIKARNYDTNALDTIDSYPLFTTDERYTSPAVPADPYIRDTDGHIELEVKHVIVATFSLSGFISSFDRVRIFSQSY